MALRGEVWDGSGKGSQARERSLAVSGVGLRKFLWADRVWTE